MTGVEPGWIAPDPLQGDRLPGLKPGSDEEAALRDYLAGPSPVQEVAAK